MIVRDCTTMKILFDYLARRRKDSRIQLFLDISEELFKPSGKKAEIHKLKGQDWNKCPRSG
jgi:hypothetical protein